MNHCNIQPDTTVNWCIFFHPVLRLRFYKQNRSFSSTEQTHGLKGSTYSECVGGEEWAAQWVLWGVKSTYSISTVCVVCVCVEYTAAAAAQWKVCDRWSSPPCWQRCNEQNQMEGINSEHKGGWVHVWGGGGGLLSWGWNMCEGWSAVFLIDSCHHIMFRSYLAAIKSQTVLIYY